MKHNSSFEVRIGCSMKFPESHEWSKSECSTRVKYVVSLYTFKSNQTKTNCDLFSNITSWYMNSLRDFKACIVADSLYPKSRTLLKDFGFIFLKIFNTFFEQNYFYLEPFQNNSWQSCWQIAFNNPQTLTKVCFAVEQWCVCFLATNFFVE